MNDMHCTSRSGPRRIGKPLFVALLAACVPLAAEAVDPAPPGAGSLLQQVQPPTPPAPLPGGTGLRIETQRGAGLPPGAPFLVQTIRITGNTLFDAATLHALVADAEGKSLTLGQLDELAGRITDYYHSHGYPLARAVIPAQTIEAGVVRLEIIEARYGTIRQENRSRVDDSLLEATLSPLRTGQPIEQSELDHALLLLSDIPGVVAGATLKPGEAVGSSDLLVDIEPASAVSDGAVLDNYGNRYTGRVRAGATVNVIDPLHHGDVFTLNGLSSGSGMSYVRMAYESLLNGHGTRAGAAFSGLRYALGGLDSLDAHGTARVQSAWAKQPLVRTRSVNLYGQLQYDHLQLRDHIDASTIRTDRHLDNLTVSVAGDARDEFLSGGVNAWNVGWTAGRVAFDDAAAQLADAGSAGIQGSFSKWQVNAARLQSLSLADGLYLAFSAQWSNRNLDPSQKITAGGTYTVRAYDMGAVSGDAGYLATIEFRHNLGMNAYGLWEAVAFVDSAHLKINHTTWAAGTNSASLSGAGLGLNWAGPEHWTARFSIARRIGAIPALVASNASLRAWLEVRKGF
jgi:hemolysin activation/secretion protein